MIILRAFLTLYRTKGRKQLLMKNLGRVLLVDDSEVSSFLGIRLMRRMNAVEAVSLAENGHKALELIKRAPLDLVLLDIHMPVMDGFEVLEALEQLQGKRGVVVPSIVILSSSASFSDRERAEAHPMVKGFLTGPLTEEKLGYLAALVAEGTEKVLQPF